MMNISEESFPDDEMLMANDNVLGNSPHFNLLTTGTIINTSICERSSSSIMGHEVNSSSSTADCQSSSGRSSSGKFSDESKETTTSDPVKHVMMKDDDVVKSLSCQDLHSEYTKKKYNHVKSKVREYIATIKAQDRRNSKKKKFGRHRSLPEAFGVYDELGANPDEMLDSSDANNNTTSTESVAEILSKKDEEVMQLKTLNEHLHENLQEKIIQVAKLKRNADSMRMELLQIKEKEKRSYAHGNLLRSHYSPRRSLPTLNYRPTINRISAATQTDSAFQPHPYGDLLNCTPGKNFTTPTPNRNLLGFFESKTIATIQPMSLNFNGDELKHESSKELRRRSNSNSQTHTSHNGSNGNQNGSDSAIESESDTETEADTLLDKDKPGDMLSFDASAKLPKEAAVAVPVPKSKKKTKKKGKMMSIKKRLHWFLGPCTKCSKDEPRADYVYSQLPMSDTMSDNRPLEQEH